MPKIIMVIKNWGASLIFLIAAHGLFGQSGSLFVICHPQNGGEPGSFGEVSGSPLTYDIWDSRNGGDLALDETYLYLADRHNPAFPFGLSVYDRSTRQLIQELPIPVVQVATGQGLLLVTCQSPPYFRVLDPQQGFQEVFSLDTTYFPVRPSKPVMAGGYAFTATSFALSMIDLQTQDTVGTFPFQAPVFPQLAYPQGIVGSDTAVYLAFDYATGAIRSSLLEFRMNTRQLTPLIPVVQDFFAVLPVPAASRLYLFSYPTYYDLAQSQLVDSIASPISYAVAYDDRQGTLWRLFPQEKALLRETPGQLPTEVPLPGSLVAFTLATEPLSTSISTPTAEIRVFPQPARQAFTVVWPGNTLRAAYLFDSLGKKVWQAEWTGPGSSQYCQLPALPAGIYALEVTTLSQRHRRLLMIQ